MHSFRHAFSKEWKFEPIKVEKKIAGRGTGGGRTAYFEKNEMFLTTHIELYKMLSIRESCKMLREMENYFCHHVDLQLEVPKRRHDTVNDRILCLLISQ
jgi:hypothetical protein